MTVDEVATLLGVPTSWVILGRYRRYRREAIERWLEDLEAAVSVSARGACQSPARNTSDTPAIALRAARTETSTRLSATLTCAVRRAAVQVESRERRRSA